jgi:uncharacterized protein YmfQ (DUF2313 family)
MAFGGFYSFPFTFGGGQSNHRTIYNSLNQGLGTGFDTTDASTVTAETSADALTLAALWSANARLTNQWDPARMTDFLGRWETIFAIRPHRSDSDNARRARLVPKFLALGAELYATTSEIATAFLGIDFLTVQYTLLADALPHWPGGTPAYPDEWTSHVAHILIRVTRYDAITTKTFHEYMTELSGLWNFLRDFNSAWSTTDWAWDGTGGPGFYLDEDANLDGEYFDS